MKNLKVLVLIVLVGFLFSCNKNSSNEEYGKKEAILIWTGDYAVDGCGFFLQINNHKYKPENESIIDNSFKTGSTLVIAEYQILNKQISSACGDLPYATLTDGIRIISITKK